MPMTESRLSENPLSSLPGQDDICPADTLSCNPCQPPTWWRPTMVSGRSAATMTKNCNTSL
ncbi:Uncharacterised protein [Mycobacteroides abscessus subsp. abscessus]|nr:Uncharacterised protein [Mycobacteroides abscessus subsp. abscessus]SKU57207.1 Uncharacterised protein [Mycobacteroides abscessus subsp. abscessus]